MENYTIEEYLRRNGFELDTTISPKTNRWNRKCGKCYASFTLNYEGTKTKYGFVFWETSDPTHDLIQKRKFEGELSIGDIEKILDIKTPTKELPAIIRLYPWSKLNL